EDAEHGVVVEALRGRDRREAAVLVPGEAAAVGAEPESARAVLVDGEDAIVREAVGLRDPREAAVVEAAQPPGGREPAIARRAPVDEADPVAREAVLRRVEPEAGALARRDAPAAGADPEPSLAIDVERADVDVAERQPVGGADRMEARAVEGREAA